MSPKVRGVNPGVSVLQENFFLPGAEPLFSLLQ